MVRSGAAATPGSGEGSGGFRSLPVRWVMKFRRVPVQVADEVPEGSGADGRQGSGGFRCRWPRRFRRVPGHRRHR